MRGLLHEKSANWTSSDMLGGSLVSEVLVSEAPTASQVRISLTSQSKLGYAKYNIRKDGRANTTVIRMYRARTMALAGIAYKTIRRNMTINGNFAVM